MNMDLLRKEFGKHIYLWSIKDWERERESDYRFLRLFKDSYVDYFIEYIKKLDNQQFEIFSKLLINRFTKKDILDIFDEAYSKEDDAIYQQIYNNFEIDQIQKGRRSIIESSLVSLDRKQIKNAINEKLLPLFKNGPFNWGDWKEWWYISTIGPWQVRTYFDVGCRDSILSYGHTIMLSEKEVLCQDVSLLNWLGLSSQSKICQLDLKDIKGAVEEIKILVKYFLDVVPCLLNGIGNELRN